MVLLYQKDDSMDMNRKKIAVFATGWGADILAQFMRGMRDELVSDNADIYLFMSYATMGERENNRRGELNINKLPNLACFDGAIIISNLLDYPEEISGIVERCKAAGVPVISHGRQIEGIFNVMTDNVQGMKELAKHLVEKHDAKNLVFIAGSPNNADSSERLQAVKEVCEEHGLDFTDDNVVFTDWDLSRAQAGVLDLYQAEKMPDAILCANDELAMSIIIALNTVGVNVPRDVLVTGFDSIPQSRIFYPSMASVDQDIHNHGKICARKIIELIDESAENESCINIPCTFTPGESCGCECSPENSDKRLRAGTVSFQKLQSSNFAIWHTLGIERSVMSCDSYADIKKGLNDFIVNSHSFEGETFHILFDPTAYRSELDDSEPGNNLGYSDKQDVIFSMKNGKVQNIRSIKTHTLIPGISDEDDPHMYVFLPIHEREVRIGYLIFLDCYDKIESAALREYSDRFNSAIEKARKAMYLKAVNDSIRELSHIDALTHVKNRNAYEQRLDDIRRRAENRSKFDFGIVLFDINNLKTINDKLGHYSGDEYIKNSCKLICATYKNSPVYRIGGDEFVVILEGKPLAQRDELMSSFIDSMKELMDSDLPPEERVSIAYGMSVYEGPSESIDDCIKRADILMYEIKKQMKLQQKK